MESKEYSMADCDIIVDGKKIAPVIGMNYPTSAATYTFPADLKEGEFIIIDGNRYDHTHAGKTIEMSVLSPAPRREWSLADRISVKEMFEKQFGVHRDTRTPAQWQKLINVYGIKVVCKTEQMDEATVRKHASETFTQRLKRQFKRKNHHA